MEYLLTITPYILQGLITTLLVLIITISGSFPIAVFLAIVRFQEIKLINFVIDFYSWVIRGTPLMFQLYFTYFAIPMIFDIRLSPWLAGSITFINSWIAYFTVTLYTALKSVDSGQYLAGKVLGLSYYQILIKIILPQAIVTALPNISNQTIEILYSTPLLASIGIADILRNTKIILSRDIKIEAFFIAAFLYLVLNGIIIKFYKILEQKFSKYKIDFSR